MISYVLYISLIVGYTEDNRPYTNESFVSYHKSQEVCTKHIDLFVLKLKESPVFKGNTFKAKCFEVTQEYMEK
jgi:hypothetical protein